LPNSGGGRKEISLAETEMPGLMATREESRPDAAAEGRRASPGSLHMTIRRGLDRGRWQRLAPTSAGFPATSIRRRITLPLRSRRPAFPCSRLKGESLTEYWDYTAKLFDWHGGGTPNMILMMAATPPCWCITGLRAEQGDVKFLDKPGSEEEEVSSSR